MAVDPRKRQKQLARRKAKDKAQATAARQRSQLVALKATLSLPTAPVVAAGVQSSIWSDGIGQVHLSRLLSNGEVAFANFLVDVFCLGVKDALFRVVSRPEYDALWKKLRSDFPHKLVEPAYVRKLVEESVAYAEDLGFPPHSDYHEAKRIFGDIDPGACSEEFTFGSDGKPAYIAGPYDSPARGARIVETLRRRFGEDSFHFTLPLTGDFDDEMEGIEYDTDE